MNATADAPLESAVVDPSAEATHAEAFDTHFAEFFFCTHVFGSARKVAEVETVFRGQPLTDEMVNAAQAKLIPREIALPVDQARRKLWNLVHAHCLPGDGVGYFYVAVSRSDEFVLAFEKLLTQFNTAADGIAEAFDSIKAKNRELWLPRMASEVDYQETIGRLLPANALQLRAAYAVEYRLRSERDARIAAKAARYRTGAVRDWFATAHASAITHDHEARRARYREPIERLKKALAGFQLQLNRGDKVTAKTFRAFEDALILFRTCAAIVAPELSSVIDEVATELADVKARAGRALSERQDSFTNVVKARKSSLNDLITRVVADCDLAIADDAVTARIGRPIRPLRLDVNLE